MSAEITRIPASEVQAGQTVRFQRREVFPERSPRITVEVTDVTRSGDTAFIWGHRITRMTRNPEWTTRHRRHVYTMRADRLIEIIETEEAH